MMGAQIWMGGVCVADCYPSWFFEFFWIVLGFALATLTRRWPFVFLAAAIATLILLSIEIAFRTLLGGEGPFDYLAFVFSFDAGQAWVIYLFVYATFLAVIFFFFSVKRLLAWALTGTAAPWQRLSVGIATLFVLAVAGFAFVYWNAPGLLPRRVVERTAELTGDAPPRCRADSARPVEGLPVFKGPLQVRATSKLVTELPASFASLPPVYTTELGGFEHLLTRRAFIRVPDPSRYGPHKAVALTVVVGADGNVLAITPKAGPPALYAQAADIASRWRFIPFSRDGKPTAVRLERIAVNIEGPELWLPNRVALPAHSDPDSLLIRVVQSNYGEQLELTIRGDGSVTFEGKDGMAVQGMHCAVVPRETIAALIDEVRRVKFFSMRDSYTTKRRDAGVLVALDDEVKEVWASTRDSEESPESLWHLIDAVVESVHGERWIKGDRFTASSLMAENWDFSRQDDANAWMAARVARHGDVAAVRDLIGLGAPLMTSSVPGSSGLHYVAEGRTALELAADRGSIELVRLLLSTKARWSPQALGSAYVSALAFGDAEMAALLLARGASPNLRGIRGKTALMAAATSGLPDLVSQVLKSGADVNAVDDAPLTALHWAAAGDYLKTVDSVRADRRRVVELLIKAGAHVDARGVFAWTPLRSNWIGLEDVTRALIAAGADVNAQDEDGVSPLMTNKNARAVQMLLEAGANPYLRNNDNQNALDVAKGDVFAGEIVAVLERWMATHRPAPGAK